MRGPAVVVAIMSIGSVGACGRWAFDDHARDGGRDGADDSARDGDNPADAPADGASASGSICVGHWCWLNPPPLHERTLRAISGTSASDIWAVGDAGTIRHYDGTAWTDVTAPIQHAFTAVAAIAPDDVWVAAREGTLLHYDGSTWAMSQTPSVATAFALAIEPGTDALWAAGDLGSVARDGSAMVAPSGLAITAALVTSSTDAWVMDLYNQAAHWNGAGWNNVTVDDFALAMWPSATPGTIWSGGDNLATLTTTGTYTVAQAGADVTAMWGAGTSDIWAVGIGAFHYDGATWTTVPRPDTSALILGLWGTASTNIWAVGAAGTILHWDGTLWNEVVAPGALRGPWLSAFAPDDTHLWVGTNDTSIWQLAGSGISASPLPAAVGSAQIEDIRGTGSDDIFASDQAGSNVVHWDGSAWSLDANAASLGLSPPSALAVRTGDVIAAGSNGTIAARTNTAWTSVYDDGSEWSGLCTNAAGEMFAVGRFGRTASRATATSAWAAGPTITGRWLQSCAVGDADAWAVGADAVEHYDGTAWTDSPATSTHGFGDVVEVAPTHVDAVANFGTIAHFDGTTWHDEASPTGADFGKLAASPGGVVYAVGGEGVILRRQ